MSKSEREQSLSDESGSTDLAPQHRRCAEAGSMIRGDAGFGRKPSKGLLANLAQYGPVEIHHYDEVDGKTIIQTLHDPNPIIESNRRKMLSGHDGYSPSRDLRRVASFTPGNYMQLKQRGIDLFDSNDWTKVAALLDSNDGLKFRTAPGVVSKKPFREYITPRQSR